MAAALTLSVASVVGGALLGGCQNDVPERPSYARDIAPLMTARCTRCHSVGTGGKDNVDPDMPPVMGVTQPIGDFTTMTGTMASCALVPTYVVTIGMPPPPSDKLDDWDVEMLERWCKNPLP